MNVELLEVWRDKYLADEIRSEIKHQAVIGWRPWQIKLPPELLWPMLEEVSQGMVTQWSPQLFGVAVQVGEPKEVSIEFVLPDLKTSPVMVKAMPYTREKFGVTESVEVHHGNTV